MDSELNKARAELDKEFLQVRDNLGEVRLQLDRVSAAGPEDDITQMLEDLEDTIKKVRTGGLLGGGSKGHRKARDHYFELRGQPT
jgi:hypothetical protein